MDSVRNIHVAGPPSSDRPTIPFPRSRARIPLVLDLTVEAPALEMADRIERSTTEEAQTELAAMIPMKPLMPWKVPPLAVASRPMSTATWVAIGFIIGAALAIVACHFLFDIVR